MHTTRLWRACAVPVVAGLLLLTPSPARAAEPQCHKSALENGVTVVCQGPGHKFRAWVQCARPNGDRYTNRRAWWKPPSTSTATCRAPNHVVERDFDIVESQ